MATIKSRLKFFCVSASKRIRRVGMLCPACGSRGADVLDRKYGVLSLERCGVCSLLFRTPTTTAEESDRYYQTAYRRGFTTDVPSEGELKRLLSMKFVGTEKHFGERIAVLKALGVQPGARILDFGCSWGYGTWQLRDAGFDAIGYEVSRDRAEYARTRLSVPLVEDPWVEHGVYDVVFSSHVIEHVPSPVEVLLKARTALRAGGLWVSFCPNGSEDFHRAKPHNYHQLWGLDHPCFPDDHFFEKQLNGLPMLISSTPCAPHVLADWAKSRSNVRSAPVSGGELLVAFRAAETVVRRSGG